MDSKRLVREKKTIQALLSLYCRHHHPSKSDQLCTECKTVFDYAIKRLSACPLQNNKPTCANCIIHCYSKDMQNKIRRIMRYSGPRLIFKHPILAICHIIDGRIKPSPLKNDRRSNPED
ncbi:nitrous oxide-stimulated promoter family protein [Desulforhopalus sp. 52FAK]